MIPRRPSAVLRSGAFCLLSLGTPAALLGQCLELPVQRNEGWVGVRSEVGGARADLGGALSLNVADLLGVEWGLSRGGREAATGTTASANWARGMLLLRVSELSVCPYVGGRQAERGFREELDLDRGDLHSVSGHTGVVVAGNLVRTDAVTLGWQSAVELVWRKQEYRGRRLIVEDSVYVEEVHGVDRAYHAGGRLGLLLRWRGVGVSGGVLLRPRSGADLLGYLSLAVALFRGEG